MPEGFRVQAPLVKGYICKLFPIVHMPILLSVRRSYHYVGMDHICDCG